jgi:hypothetical protein
MFYYLLYNSSFSFIVNNRLFSTILYGSILYILTHAILNYCSIEILGIINNYYWYIFSLDIISLGYALYQTIMNPMIDNSGIGCGVGAPEDNLAVSFNLLKNKINTIGSYFNNNLTITEPTPDPTPRTPLRINTNHQSQSQQQQQQPPTKLDTIDNLGNMDNMGNIDMGNLGNMDNMGNIDMGNLGINDNENNVKNGKYSTPLSSLGKTPISSNQSGNASTPLSFIRENFNTVPQPIINEDTYQESNVGSDLGSVMDLDDFERSL